MHEDQEDTRPKEQVDKAHELCNAMDTLRQLDRQRSRVVRDYEQQHDRVESLKADLFNLQVVDIDNPVRIFSGPDWEDGKALVIRCTDPQRGPVESVDDIIFEIKPVE